MLVLNQLNKSEAFSQQQCPHACTRAGAIPSEIGNLTKLAQLWLNNNKIGDKGLEAFSGALAGGALPSLKDAPCMNLTTLAQTPASTM